MGNAFFEDYIRAGHREVEGWTQPGMLAIVQCLDEFQEKQGLGGDVAEIGIHHGKFFLALHNCLRLGERSLAIDLFDDQIANVDNSGRGNLQAFQANLAKHGHSPERCKILAADSIAMSERELSAVMEPQLRTRLFSIDGGHTPEHTVSDFMLAASCSHVYGVLFIDDYYNPHWPGVHMGINRLFFTSTPKFVPFGYGRDKLLFTSISWRKRYFELLCARFKGLPGFKVVNMFGYNVAALAMMQGLVPDAK